MKKLLLVLSFFTIVAARGQTSVYHPFPDSNAIWNFDASVVMCQFNWSAHENYSITISGDTVINSMVYHKLVVPHVIYLNTDPCAIVSNGYKGCFRQDTAARKVYYVPPAAMAEQLLYDFTLQPGDTVKGYLPIFTSTVIVVKSVDSVRVGSSYRKSWLLDSCYNIRMTEGIGSEFGLIQKHPGCITDFADFSLLCFKQNGKTLYPDTTTTCEVLVSVNNLPVKESFISIYPNPATSHITINRLPNPSKGGASMSLVIADLFGRVVHQSEIINNQSGMDVSALPSGVYVVVVREEEKVYRGKLVKQ